MSLDQPTFMLSYRRHGDRAQEARNQAALRIAESLRLPILATNGVRYARAEDREMLDLFTSIRHGTSLDRAGPFALYEFTALFALATYHAICLFHDLPEAVANTVYLAQRLEFKLDDLGYEFPHYDVGESDTMGHFSAQACYGGEWLGDTA